MTNVAKLPKNAVSIVKHGGGRIMVWEKEKLLLIERRTETDVGEIMTASTNVELIIITTIWNIIKKSTNLVNSLRKKR